MEINDSYDNKVDPQTARAQFQLNFSIHCATTALGISSQRLTHGTELSSSIYRFHVYYHAYIEKIRYSFTSNKNIFKI